MGHADGLGPLGLAGVDGDDAAPDGFGHVGAGVDGHHQNGGQPHAVKAHAVVGEVGQAKIDKHGLEHHGSAPEDLHINAHDHPDQLQHEPLGQRVLPGVRDGVQNAADQADDTADDGGHQGEDQGVFDAVEVHRPVFAPQQSHVLTQLDQFLHKGTLLSNTHRSLRPNFRAGGGARYFQRG